MSTRSTQQRVSDPRSVQGLLPGEGGGPHHQRDVSAEDRWQRAADPGLVRTRPGQRRMDRVTEEEGRLGQLLSELGQLQGRFELEVRVLELELC